MVTEIELGFLEIRSPSGTKRPFCCVRVSAVIFLSMIWGCTGICGNLKLYSKIKWDENTAGAGFK